MSSQPVIILDSSPLITLALFPVHRPAIHEVLKVADVLVVDTVALETTVNPSHRDARLIQALLETVQIKRYPIPADPVVDPLIEAYNKVDEGEADTIKLALTRPDAQLVLDDEAAFVVATHFGLSPIMLLDLLTEWANAGRLPKPLTLTIVGAVASRYSEAFVSHMKAKLGEV